MKKLFGYTQKVMRVDLATGRITIEELPEDILKKWVGGVGLGIKYLYEEVPPGVEWSDPENLLVWATGRLAGSGVFGAGSFNLPRKTQ